MTPNPLYYLGAALDHYCCYQVYITKTRGTWVVDTVELFPSKTAMPQTSSKYLASIADLELSHALHNPAPADPFNEIASGHFQELRQLSEFFTGALTPTATQHLPPVSQAVSQFRKTILPAPVRLFRSPSMATPQHAPLYHETPTHTPALTRYLTPRAPNSSTISEGGSHCCPNSSTCDTQCPLYAPRHGR
jgi:hypothetical protein